MSRDTRRDFKSLLTSGIERAVHLKGCLATAAAFDVLFSSVFFALFSVYTDVRKITTIQMTDEMFDHDVRVEHLLKREKSNIICCANKRDLEYLNDLVLLAFSTLFSRIHIIPRHTRR